MKTLLTKEYKEEILNRLSNLRIDTKSRWGQMNANEMVCHCSDQIKMCLNIISVKDVSTFLNRTVLKKLIFLGMKAPKGKVQTLRELDTKKDGTKPTTFTEDVNQLKELIEKVYSTNEDFNFGNHGAFGKLTRDEWGKLTFLHLDYHFMQFNI